MATLRTQLDLGALVHLSNCGGPLQARAPSNLNTRPVHAPLPRHPTHSPAALHKGHIPTLSHHRPQLCRRPVSRASHAHTRRPLAVRHHPARCHPAVAPLQCCERNGGGRVSLEPWVQPRMEGGQLMQGSQVRGGNALGRVTGSAPVKGSAGGASGMEAIRPSGGSSDDHCTALLQSLAGTVLSLLLAFGGIGSIGPLPAQADELAAIEAPAATPYGLQTEVPSPSAPQAAVPSPSAPQAAMPSPSTPQAVVSSRRSSPIIDGARSIPLSKQVEMEREIAEVEKATGYKIRLATRYGPGSYPTADDIRAAFELDQRTILVVEDVTSPNILNLRAGDDVVHTKLRRQFFLELQSRFGNQFFVREEGELEALTQVMNSLTTCLYKPEGCTFVPGLTDEVYNITLVTSIAGGAVFGFAARQRPMDRIAYSWQWVLLFSPLWGILLVSFGILPISARTSDFVPIAKNLAAFTTTASALYLTPILGRPRLPSFELPQFSARGWGDKGSAGSGGGKGPAGSGGGLGDGSGAGGSGGGGGAGSSTSDAGSGTAKSSQAPESSTVQKRPGAGDQS